MYNIQYAHLQFEGSDPLSQVSAKRLIKRGEHLHNAGEYERAIFMLQRALGMTTDYGDETEVAYYLPRIRHRLALSYAELGEERVARKNFDESIKQFKPCNNVGRARVLRDYGWWLVQLGEVTAGRQRLYQALTLMQDVEEGDARDDAWHREYLVTEGMVARLSSGVKDGETQQILLAIDKQLKGGDKWIYELDNLRYLIPLLSLRQRPRFIARAAIIETRIVLHEDLSVLGNDLRDGTVVRGVFSLGLRMTRRALPF